MTFSKGIGTGRTAKAGPEPLWCPGKTPDRALIVTDFTALELRVLAHFQRCYDDVLFDGQFKPILERLH